MAKTLRNKYDKILSYDSIKKAYLDTRSGKKLRKEVILFSLNEEENLLNLYYELKTGTYVHGNYTSFIVHEPKDRIIEKAPFRDRIVHTWLVENFLMPYYYPRFIKNTYACLKYRGMHKAALDLQQGMKEMKRSYREYYILKMDVRKFFNSIDKRILYDIISKKIKDPKVLWLIRKILSAQKKRKGIEIGNFTSQTFANIYLNEIDQYIKNELKVKYYYRYMDDSVLFTKTKDEAKRILEKIKLFLKDNLNLELNDKTAIFKSKQGVNFCGYKINEYRLKVRNKGKKKFKKKVKFLLIKIKEDEQFSGKNARTYLTGHIGYFNPANTFDLERKNIFLMEDLQNLNIL